jgi:hypothetical protein
MLGRGLRWSTVAPTLLGISTDCELPGWEQHIAYTISTPGLSEWPIDCQAIYIPFCKHHGLRVSAANLDMMALRRNFSYVKQNRWGGYARPLLSVGLDKVFRPEIARQTHSLHPATVMEVKIL